MQCRFLIIVMVTFLAVACLVDTPILMAEEVQESTEEVELIEDEEESQEDEFFDPLETFNRLWFDFFYMSYYVAIHPVVGVYNGVVPQILKDRVDDFAGFVRTPLTLVNDVLQGNFDGGVQSTIERNVKSLPTLGLYDFERNTEPRRFEDYGQTLGVYGMPEGPFLFFPLAPSVRDLGAYTAQTIFLDPLLFFVDAPLRLSFTGLRALSLFSNIDRGVISLYSSVDAYALVRYGFLQQRRGAILNRGQREELEERQDDFELEIDEDLLNEVYQDE